MNIDWFTVAIQAINFLALVWILKKFLYKPILKAMDGRQKAVFAKLHEAEKREKKAEKLQEELTEAKQKVKNEAKQIILNAHKEADSDKSEMLKSTQNNMKDKQLKFEHQLEIEKKALHNTVRHLAGETLVKTARDAMKELATKDLEKEMFTVFADKIKTGNSTSFNNLVKAIKKGHKVVLTSANTPTSEEKKKISSALKEISGTTSEIVYKENKELICGIELLVDTAMLRWGFDKYLETFARSLNDALDNITV